jgi:hypothetical protein
VELVALLTGVEHGQPEVGPSQAELLAALYRDICAYGGECPQAQRPDGVGDACCRRGDGPDDVGPCWLRVLWLANSEEQAAALWERMKQAANAKGDVGDGTATCTPQWHD